MISLEIKEAARQKVDRALYQVRTEPSLIGFGPIFDRFANVKCAPKHPTMATDGTNLFYGPTFVMAQHDAVLRTIVIHEAMHVSLAHHLRLRDGNWDLKIANIAMDHVINNMITQTDAFKRGFLLPPPGADWMCDPKYAGTEWTWEAVYRDLIDNTGDTDGDGPPDDNTEAGDEDSDDTGPGDGDGDEGEDGEGDAGDDTSDDQGEDVPDESGGGDKGDGTPEGVDGGPGEILPAPPEVVTDEEIQEINEDLAQGEFMQKMAGSGTGTEQVLRRMREDRDEDIGDWEFMRDMLEDAFSPERTWSRPNLIYQEHGYLPARQIGAGTLHAQFDMSASMTVKEIEVCYANLLAMAQDLGIETIKVGYFDTTILRPSGETWQEFDCLAGEKPEVELVGRGGTDFTPIFQCIEEECEEVTALVVFTDGEAAVYGQQCQMPDYEVIWATTNRAPWFYDIAEFGHVAKVKVRNWVGW